MFKKVIGKECKNGNCKMYGQMKEATAYLCEECQSELQPIVKQNTPMVLAVAAIGLVLMGGIGYAVRTYVINRAGDLIDGGTGDSGSKPGKNPLAMQYAIQAEGDGRPQNVPVDHVFRSGDKLRFLVKSAGAAHYYVFYEDRANDKIEVLFPAGTSRPTTANEPVAVPAGNDNWIRMDANPGQERFILIASAAPVDELDFGGSNCPRSRFDTALEKVKSKYGIAEVKPMSDLDWTKVEAKGKGLTLTRITVQHQ